MIHAIALALLSLPLAEPGQGFAPIARGGPPAARVLVDEPGDGNVWARAATYNARFGADAVEFIPVLGARAPHSLSVSLTLAAVRVGGTGLALAEAVAPLRVGERVVYERGALREVYDLLDRPLSTTRQARRRGGGACKAEVGAFSTGC